MMTLTVHQRRKREFPLKPSLSDFSVSTVSTESSDVSSSSKDNVDDDSGSVISSLTDNNYNSSSGLSNNGRRVSFGVVQVREYERIASDHPETTIGVPIGIGWAFKAQPTESVERFDAQRRRRQRRNSSFHTNTEKKGPARLGAMTRKKLLLEEFQVPLSEVRMAEKACEKFKKQLQAMRENGGNNASGDSGKKKKKTSLRGMRKGLMKRCGMRSTTTRSIPMVAVACN
jgi:hypothetical protein